MAMDLRILTHKDTAQAKALWAYCFQEGEAADDWFFTYRHCPENALGAFEGDTLLACLSMLPYTISLRGVDIPSAYIVGVSVAHYARGLGLSTQLLEGAAQVMRERGMMLSPLYPFSYTFYERKGWAVCTDRLQFRLAMEDIRQPLPKEETLRMAPLEAASNRDLVRAYEQFTRPYTGYVVRNEKSFAWKREELRTYGQEGVAAFRGADCVGYVLFKQNMEEGCLEVEELVYADEAAMDGLLSVLAAHHSTASYMGITGPLDSPLRRRIVDGRKKVLLEPHAMMRIVNAEALLKALFEEDAGAEGYIRILDRQIPANQGLYDLRDFSKVEAATAHPVQTLEIATLVQSVFAYAGGGDPALSRMLAGRERCKVQEGKGGERIPFIWEVM